MISTWCPTLGQFAAAMFVAIAFSAVGIWLAMQIAKIVDDNDWPDNTRC